ncbi:MAG: glycosyltransferase family 2 protein [bacterium]|nr:glycosyltransferase family 2 protein [bacterium]
MTIEEAAQQPVSVIVACLHEEDTIRECLERITRAMPNAEVLVVHGGRDRTYEIAAEMARENPHIVPIKNENDQGKGHAIQVGIGRARYDVMGQFDADLQFAPEDLPALFLPILNGEADLVIGSRFMAGSDTSGYRFSFFRTVGNWIVNGWVSLMSGRRITDVTTGSKAWTRAAIEKIAFKDVKFVYEIEIVMYAIRRGLRVKQVPVRYHNRQGGVSGHGKGWNELKSIIRTGFKLLWRATEIRFERL